MTEQSPIEVAMEPPDAAKDRPSDEEMAAKFEDDISHVRELLKPLPADHPDRPLYLYHLASRLSIIFEYRKPPEMARIFEAIRAGREAVDCLPPDHEDRQWIFASLTYLLGDRFAEADTTKPEIPRDVGVYVPDCGPGELDASNLPRPRRILGCGPSNLPYDDNGNLNLIDILSGVFDEKGRWSYVPIVQGAFMKDKFRGHDVGAYKYEPGNVLFEEDGTSHMIGQSSIWGWNRQYLGVDSRPFLEDQLLSRSLVDKGILTSLFPRENVTSNLCNACRNINPETTFSSLSQPISDCDLCNLLSKCSRKENGELKLLDARSFLRICTIPGTEKSQDPQHDLVPATSSEGASCHVTTEEEITVPRSTEPAVPEGNETKLEFFKGTEALTPQPGLPAFLESGSPEHFKLIKEWLQLCDEGKCGHPSRCVPERSFEVKPARVLRVSNGADSLDMVQFVATENLENFADYVALSHCWGSGANGTPWCTTRQNVTERLSQGILVESLPANFRDAIQVTREIGEEYLWIDSLCIIQGDIDDWIAEGHKMAGIFRNAYCVLAASSATSSLQGFLQRPASESDAHYVVVPESSYGPLYISSAIDDFPGDVEQGILNTRGWVLQERVLARRTIHFTNRQTYWECGGGIRCETLTFMRNEGKWSVFSDPSFPRSLKGRATVAKLQIFSGLFETYSQLRITHDTDRPIAVAALAKELAIELETDVSHGVFEKFLHRGLLWHQSGQPLERIAFSTHRRVPSWSWMAYSGPIKFANIKLKFEWENSVKLKEDGVLEARLIQLQLESRGCQAHPTDSRCHEIICKKTDECRGQLWFDGLTLDEIFAAQTAVIIGREQEPEGVRLGSEQKYFILLVAKDEADQYARIGMGYVERGLLDFDEEDGVISIT